MFEDIKGVSRSCKSKDRQYNGLKNKKGQWIISNCLPFRST